MQIYLVGGAVRDQLLNREIIEKDWVVVGATPEQMLTAGYTQVGKDFPVFLHPETKDEHALARTERKTGQGYTGFTVHAAPDVTLEEDLIRRDLTINAMAQDADGQIVDPFNGQADLNNRLLRHVSQAFVEDPLRVLRVARFAARYDYLGFSVAEETLSLMRTLSESGELSALTPERVWKELSRALLEASPWVFADVLDACGALKVLLPPIDAKQSSQSLKALSEPDLEQRYCALTQGLSKEDVAHCNAKLKAPNTSAQLALLHAEFRESIAGFSSLSPEQVLQVLDKTDAWRKPDRFKQLLSVNHALQHTQIEPWLQALDKGLAINIQDIIAQGHKGAAIRAALNEQRIALIKAL